MRIRRNASSSAAAPPRFEPSPPLPVEVPPPAHESRGGFASKTSSSSSPEPCVESVSPWDLVDHLNLSDPKEEERFVETYSVPVLCRRRTSWLLAPIMAVGSIMNEEEEDGKKGVIFELHVAKTNKATRTRLLPKTKMAKIEDSDDGGGGGARAWTCKRNDGRGWFCRRPVSRPDSLCLHHSGQRTAAACSSSKPRRKRAAADADEGFYYYAGFGPSSRSTKRRRRSSISVLEELVQIPSERNQEAVHQLPGEHIEVQLLEEHVDSTAGQARADGANHQIAPARVDDESKRCDYGVPGITGCDEVISGDDDEALDCNGEPAGDEKRKRRRKKPVKARSVNALM